MGVYDHKEALFNFLGQSSSESTNDMSDLSFIFINPSNSQAICESNEAIMIETRHDAT